MYFRMHKELRKSCLRDYPISGFSCFSGHSVPTALFNSTRWYAVISLIQGFQFKCMIVIQITSNSNDRPAPFSTPAATKIEAGITVVRHS